MSTWTSPTRSAPPFSRRSNTLRRARRRALRHDLQKVPTDNRSGLSKGIGPMFASRRSMAKRDLSARRLIRQAGAMSINRSSRSSPMPASWRRWSRRWASPVMPTASSGRVGGVEVSRGRAWVCFATAAATRLLDHACDHVMVVGIAGGLGPASKVSWCVRRSSSTAVPGRVRPPSPSSSESGVFRHPTSSWSTELVERMVAWRPRRRHGDLGRGGRLRPRLCLVGGAGDQ